MLPPTRTLAQNLHQSHKIVYFSLVPVYFVLTLSQWPTLWRAQWKIIHVPPPRSKNWVVSWRARRLPIPKNAGSLGVLANLVENCHYLMKMEQKSKSGPSLAALNVVGQSHGFLIHLNQTGWCVDLPKQAEKNFAPLDYTNNQLRGRTQVISRIFCQTLQLKCKV